MKINLESSIPEIWIRFRFHNGSGTPSLVHTLKKISTLVCWISFLLNPLAKKNKYCLIYIFYIYSPKRDSTLEEHWSSIRISRFAKIPTFYRDWLRSFNQEKVQSFELHRGGLKDINCSAQNVALFVIHYSPYHKE